MEKSKCSTHTPTFAFLRKQSHHQRRSRMTLIATSSAFLTALFLCVPGWAACIDIGTEPFLANVETVTLCLKSECEVAVRTRSCGNVHYISADYSSATGVWLFRTRFHDPANSDDDEQAVFYQFVDKTTRPLGKVKGADVWLLDENRPIQAINLEDLGCSSDGSEEPCAFIDSVAQALRDKPQSGP